MNPTHTKSHTTTSPPSSSTTYPQPRALLALLDLSHAPVMTAFESRSRLRCLARGRLRRQPLPTREARVRKIANVRGDVSSEGE